MRISGRHMQAAVLAAAMAVGVSHAGETSIRQELLGPSAGVSSLYSIDDHTTVFAASSRAEAVRRLRQICSERGLELAVSESGLGCEGVFRAEQASAYDAADGPLYILKSKQAQPLAYRTSALPSYERIEAPANGRIEGALSSIDMYQYMYALCEKEGGTPAMVVSKRAGRFARLVEVAPAEALAHLLSTADGKDPWFFACDGVSRFIVEKDYQMGPEEDRVFSFHQDRGLEWVDYIKRGDTDRLAALDSAAAADKAPGPAYEARFMQEMAWEISTLKTDFVKTSSGSRYEGHYNDNSKNESCDLVSIRHTRKDSAEVFNYRVCGAKVALIDSGSFAGKDVLALLGAR